ncbi:hypothetical protein BKA70DRAFT_1434344 [Coprinopsis sp. MPI-PUGE-AT-0042]|nr:hypothetical protein BKA70DRAFT_1434344 [Coprinopsis sp. MPI-PUGE-AT-0042]
MEPNWTQPKTPSASSTAYQHPPVQLYPPPPSSWLDPDGNLSASQILASPGLQEIFQPLSTNRFLALPPSRKGQRSAAPTPCSTFGHQSPPTSTTSPEYSSTNAAEAQQAILQHVPALHTADQQSQNGDDPSTGRAREIHTRESSELEDGYLAQHYLEVIEERSKPSGLGASKALQMVRNKLRFWTWSQKKSKTSPTAPPPIARPRFSMMSGTTVESSRGTGHLSPARYTVPDDKRTHDFERHRVPERQGSTTSSHLVGHALESQAPRLHLPTFIAPVGSQASESHHIDSRTPIPSPLQTHLSLVPQDAEHRNHHLRIAIDEIPLECADAECSYDFPPIPIDRNANLLDAAVKIIGVTQTVFAEFLDHKRDS